MTVLLKIFTRLIFLITLLSLFSCKNKKFISHTYLTVNTKMLDSIRQHSDTNYSKPYKRIDFVTAEYFISKKDSSITQVMKDSSGMVRQLIIEKNKRRIYIAAFYPNGQQQYKISLDAFGRYDGAADEFYPNGIIKRSGIYKNGFHSGKWKNYDEQGNYISTDEYNENGQQERSYKE